MSYTELDLNLTEDHVSLKESVNKFSMEVLRPASIELDKLSPDEVIRKDSLYWDCMKKMYELKYHTVLIPEKYGGLELDALATHIFWEELAYGSIGFAISLACACFSSFYASLFPKNKLVEKYIIPYVECKDAGVMSCWGITEPEHGSDNMMPGTSFFNDPQIVQQVRAEKRDGEWVINGQKSAWVSNGPVASDITLFLNINSSRGMAGGGICLVNLNQSGVIRGKPLDKIGQRELPQGEIFFDDVVCPGDFMLVKPGVYEMMTELALAHANATMGASFTGVGRAAYDIALQYSTQRIQGGKRLCEHQLVQKKLFDMFVKIESARALSRSVLNYNKSVSLADLKYSIASKVYCTQAAFEVTSEAIQLLGGYGLSREFPIEKFFRDARAGLIEDGSNDTLGITAGTMLIEDEID